MQSTYLLFLVAAVALAACAAPAQPSTAVTISETEFAFSPGSLTVPVGEPVTITFENAGAQEHDFVIEQIAVADVVKDEAADDSGHDMSGMEMDYDLHVATTPGGTSTLIFTATELGTYDFYCAVKGHKEAGMVGKLVVVDQ
jgi:uncharacterized cupredoxin-like copper-binding protein